MDQPITGGEPGLTVRPSDFIHSLLGEATDHIVSPPSLLSVSLLLKMLTFRVKHL